jgi:dihydrofolate reductase
MRRIVNSTYISLDGVVENPHLWPAGKPDDGTGTQIQTELLEASDAVLMGRRTYDVFAATWPGRSGDPYSDRINAMRKHVVSTTLSAPAWENTHVIRDDVANAIAALKAEPGQDIVQYGVGPVTRLLLEAGLLDELRLWVHPLFVGRASADDLLFRETDPVRFELVDSRPLASGIVVLSYAVA